MTNKSKIRKKKEQKIKSVVNNHSKDDNMKIDSDKQILKSKNNVKENKKKKKMKQKIIPNKVESDSDNDVALNNDCDETMEDEQMEQDEEDISDDANQLLSVTNSKKKLKKAKQKFVSNNVESKMALSDEESAEDTEVESKMTLSNEEESVDEDSEHEDESNKRDDDLLPIERANKKLLKKKQKEE